MKFSTASVAASALTFASLISAQSATINTPTQLFTCEPAAITWNGGTAPYYVRVYQGGSTTNLIETLQASVSSNSYTWNVDVAAGTSVTLGLTDSTGATVYSAAVTVSTGSSTSCVGNKAGAAGAGSSAAGLSAAATSAAASSAAATSAHASSAVSSAPAAGSSAASHASSAPAAGSSAASHASSAGSSAAAAPSASASGKSGASTLALSGLAGVAAVGVALLA